jgi:transposase-like protein
VAAGGRDVPTPLRPLAELLDGAEADVLAYAAFPAAHWRQIWSTDEIVKIAAVQAAIAVA